jgi:hypothetical protein
MPRDVPIGNGSLLILYDKAGFYGISISQCRQREPCPRSCLQGRGLGERGI